MAGEHPPDAVTALPGPTTRRSSPTWLDQPCSGITAT